MNDWYVRAPWWQLALAFAVPVSVLRFLGMRFLQADPVGEAALAAGLHGVGFGLVLGVVVARQNRGMRSAAGSDDPGFVVRAAKVAARGPVPDDPVLREAARRIALYRGGLLRRYRRWVVPFLALVGTVVLGLAIHRGLLAPGLVAAVVLAALAVLFVALPRHAERRAEQLRHPPGRDPDGEAC